MPVSRLFFRTCLVIRHPFVGYGAISEWLRGKTSDDGRQKRAAVPRQGQAS